MKRGKYILLTVLAATGLMLGGCTSTSSPTSGQTTNKKEQTVSLSGTVQTEVEDGFLLLTDEGVKKIDSPRLDLSVYMGQKIEVSGQYSGDILFVDIVDSK